MNSRPLVIAARWLLTFAALASIVLLYSRWLRVNPTTVALTLVLFVLLVAARLGLRHAVLSSAVATACYNYFFLPPLGTFVISDPQNWIALFTFLVTAIVGSRLSQKARDEADRALRKQREMELLFTLSRDLLQTENVADLVHALPTLINIAARSQSATLYLLEDDRVYHAGVRLSSPAAIPHLRQLALTLTTTEVSSTYEAHIPLRAGVRPRGLLGLTDVRLSRDTLQAIGGLTSIALDRAQALEAVARGEAVKESERLRTLILDSITHELRTPLTSIKGATGTLLTPENVTADDRHELLSIIDEEADKLNRLVSQVVEMAQIETQEVHMTFSAVSLASILSSAQENCSWVSASHLVTARIDSATTVFADPEMIARVFCNLIENAAKYSSPGSPIVISAEQSGGSVITSVADRGSGIDSSEQDLIFDRLYRSRLQKQQVSGTGMGLPISRAILEAHRGYLTVTSQVGRGSVFSFSLPAAPDEHHAF